MRDMPCAMRHALRAMRCALRKPYGTDNASIARALPCVMRQAPRRKPSGVPTRDALLEFRQMGFEVRLHRFRCASGVCIRRLPATDGSGRRTSASTIARAKARTSTRARATARAAVRWPYGCGTVAVRWPYGGRTVAVRWPYGDCTVAVRLRCGGRTVAVRWPYGGCTVAVRWPYGGRTVAVRWPCFPTNSHSFLIIAS